MFLEQQLEFLVERLCLVMGSLVGNVGDDSRQIRATHRKRSITFLPGEITEVRVRIVNPLRRIPLHQLRDLAHGDCGRTREGHVNMVLNPADLVRMKIVLLGDPRQIRPQTRLHLRRNEPLTMLRGKHQVKIQVCVGV